MRGRLIWFNPEKRHGFIRTEDGERLRVEEAGFEPGTCSATAARAPISPSSAKRCNGSGDAHAIKVTVVDDASGGRARARRRG